MRKALASLIPHVLLAVSMFMAAHSARNYYALAEVVLPSVEALAPVTVGKVNEAIALKIIDGTEGQAAKRMLESHAKEMRMLHSSWLAQAEAHATFARNALFAWLLALVASGALVAIQFKQAKSAP